MFRAARGTVERLEELAPVRREGATVPHEHGGLVQQVPLVEEPEQGELEVSVLGGPASCAVHAKVEDTLGSLVQDLSNHSLTYVKRASDGRRFFVVALICRMLWTGEPEDARPSRLAHLRLVCEHWGYFRAPRAPRARARALAGRSRPASRPRRPASASARVARPFRGLAKTPATSNPRSLCVASGYQVR